MKRSLLLFVMCFLYPRSTQIVSGDSIEEILMQVHKACVQATGVDEALIVKANTEKILEPDPKFKCYVKCILEAGNIIRPDGTIDEDQMISLIPDAYKPILGPIVHGCGTQHGNDLCETSWNTHSCYAKTDPEHYFLP